jgi:hypothetical protein
MGWSVAKDIALLIENNFLIKNGDHQFLVMTSAVVRRWVE